MDRSRAATAPWTSGGKVAITAVMWPITLITVYCLFIMAASLLGGWLPSIMRLTHTRMQLMMSFVGGLMMGVALLHMIPHAAIEAESMDHAMLAAVLGLLGMFFAIRVFPCPRP